MKLLQEFISRLFPSQASLEEGLKKCRNIYLSEERNVALRRRVLRSVEMGETKQEFPLFRSLIQKIRQVALSIAIPRTFQAILKERILMLVEFQGSGASGVRLPFFFVRHRKALAATLAVIFSFSLLFHFTFEIPRVEASYLTALEEITGSVVVVREGKSFPGKSGLLLKVDDVIKTGQASKAVIRFLDQSVSRLDENTEMKISKLFVNPFNKTETIVEVILNRGRLWARVVNLIDNFSHFQVKARNTVAVAKKKAAFDVSIVQNGRATISAIHNRVDIVVATDKKVIETTLVKGFTAEMKTDNPTAPQIRPERIPEAGDSWMATNLAEDKAYMDTVKQENEEQFAHQVTVLPGNLFYAMKELSEGTKIAFTLNELSKQKKIIFANQEKLAEAQVLLNRGQTEAAENLLSGFQSQTQAVMARVKELETSSPAQAAAIRTQVKEVLDTYEKNLALMLPTDPLYRMKEAIARTKVAVASGVGVAEKTQELLTQAGEKLLEAHDFVEQGNPGAAAVQVQAYTKAVSDVFSEVQKLSDDDKEKAVSVIIENKGEDFKSLQAMSTPSRSPASAGSSAPLGGATRQLPPGTVTPVLIPFGEATVATSTSVGSSAIPMLPQSLEQTSLEDSAHAQSVATADLKSTISEAKTEVFTRLGEAVLEVQKEQSSPEVLKKLQEISHIDINGKSVVNVSVSPNKVSIKTDNKTISVVSVGTATEVSPGNVLKLPIANSKTLK